APGRDSRRPATNFRYRSGGGIRLPTRHVRRSVSQCVAGSTTMRKKKSLPFQVLREHSLSLTLAAILAFFSLMYQRAEPSTHLGSFYGNAIADWLGVLVFVIASKYCYEIGSGE